MADDRSAALKQAMEAVTQCLRLSDNQLRDIMKSMDDGMNQGLGKDTNASASIKMFPTYVRHLPDGSENGNFLALDLGGTNFRVLLVVVSKDNGKNEVTMKSRIYTISKDTMLGPGEELFDHIAQCIEDFMAEHNLMGMTLPLGFTFSFPCQQKGLAKSYLQTWTKGFKCSGVVGEDIVALLHRSIKKKKTLNVECIAVINDTVGTLMACAHQDRNCLVGLILGTGTNACYMEDLNRVELWDEAVTEPKQVIINTEWGAYGNNGELDHIRSEFDTEIDNNSLNPGKQIYEKMISGMYMGELVRLVLVKLIKQKLIFNGHLSEEMTTPQRFYTKYVSEIESEEGTSEFENTQKVLSEMGYNGDISKTDRKIVHDTCTLVSERAASLASAGIAVLLNRINRSEVTVGVDGSLFRYHPHFKNNMKDKIHHLAKPGIKCKLMLSSDGSGKGAALVAAVAYRAKLSSSN